MLTHVLIKFALHKPLCRRILNLIIASAEIIIVTEEQCALRRRAHAHILLAPMLTARNDGNLEIKMASQSTKEASSVHVVQSTAMPDKLALLRQTHVNIQFVPTLMVLH